MKHLPASLAYLLLLVFILWEYSSCTSSSSETLQEDIIDIECCLWVYSNEALGIGYEYSEMRFFRDTFVLRSLQNGVVKSKYSIDDGMLHYGNTSTYFECRLSQEPYIKTIMNGDTVKFYAKSPSIVQVSYETRLIKNILDTGDLKDSVELSFYKEMLWDSYFPLHEGFDLMEDELD